MKKIHFILLGLISAVSGVFAAGSENWVDPAGFTHKFNYEGPWQQGGVAGEKNRYWGYTDINESPGDSLTKRVIKAKDGTEAKRIYGDMDIIGATISIPIQTSAWGQTGYKYWPAVRSMDFINEIYYGTLTKITRVNDIPSHYSENSAISTFDFSSKPTRLEREELDGSKVIFARLYWAGGISAPWNSSGWLNYYPKNSSEFYNYYYNEFKGFNTIKFGTPDGGYHNLTADKNDVFWYGSFIYGKNGKIGGMYFMYQASVDVTNLVQNSLKKNQRTFSAGNIKATTSVPKLISMYRDGSWSWYRSSLAPHYGGWTLVIVYDFGKDASREIKPKNVNVYDGLKILDPRSPQLPQGQQNGNLKQKKLQLEFSGFYTPPSGEVKSTLAFLSFGGKKEVGDISVGYPKSDKLEIWKGNDTIGNWLTVASNNSSSGLSPNPEGNQFNSSITKFDKEINPGKTYNNQMDLDVFDVTGKIINAQTKAWVRLIAESEYHGGSVYAERANVGLVAFSTELYEPKVCYQEKLFVKGKNDPDSAFKPVSTNSSQQTKAKKGDILRVQVAIKNKGDDKAERLMVTANLDPKSAEYKNGTTYIRTDAPAANNFTVGSHNPDNTGFQKRISNNSLAFAVGRNAGAINSSAPGGTIDKTNQAFVQYDTTLNQSGLFKENTYEASFENLAINLKYNGEIKKCEEKTHYLSVSGSLDNFRAVNKKFSQNNDPQNLYTQLAGRAFDIKIVHFGEEAAKINKLEKLSEDIEVNVDIVTMGATCEASTNVMDGNARKIKFIKNSLPIIELQNIMIKKAYNNLHVRLSFKDPGTGLIKVKCNSDTFTVRPKEFKIYDLATNKNWAKFDNLIGGKNYSNLGVLATDNNNNPAQGYTTNLEISQTNPDTTSHAKLVPFIPSTLTGCTAPATLTTTRFKTNFTDGKGKFIQPVVGSTSGASEKNFSYNNVGDAKLSILDNTWTAASQDKQKEDCIVGSDTVMENSQGKIGCEIKKDILFRFIPKDIHVQDLKLANYNNSDMTYISNDDKMYATATFDIIARLDDNSAASMYTAGCYSKNGEFTLDIDEAINDLEGYGADNKRKKFDTVAGAQSKIVFFNNDTNSNITKRSASATGSGIYDVKAKAFNKGIAKAQVKFNFDRKVHQPVNPFTVSNQIFTFKDVKDSETKTNNSYIKPASTIPNSIKFYYGIVYAPNYEGPKTGFAADVFFGVYCKTCDKSTYTLANSQRLPQTSDWYLNTAHVSTAQGKVISYTAGKASTTVTAVPNIDSISNGIQKIALSSTTKGTDTIDIDASPWLIYNKTNPSAIKNTFKVEFFDGARWGGKSLNSLGEETNSAGTVLNKADSTLDDYSPRNNKRLDW